MFGNLEEQQAKMAERLGQIKLSAEVGDGSIRIDCTAAGMIENITIDPQLIEHRDVEQLEDLMITAVNRAFELIKETEAREANSLLKDMLPPGMSGLFGA